MLLDIEAANGSAHGYGTHVFLRSLRDCCEKDVDPYRRLVDRHRLDPATTWTIGKSPKSDVAPARAAGLRAVFIPNANTWALEHAELDPDDDGILRLRAVGELLDHF